MDSEKTQPNASEQPFVQPLTVAMRKVLERLSSDEWIMDRSGKDMLCATMHGPKWDVVKIASRTVSSLVDAGLIRFDQTGVSDYVITDKGRAVLVG